MPSTALASSAPKISLNAIQLPDSRTRAAIFLIFIASLLDFSLTCHHVSLGAREMNPVLAPLFHAGRFMEAFWLKTFMTAAESPFLPSFPIGPSSGSPFPPSSPFISGLSSITSSISEDRPAFFHKVSSSIPEDFPPDTFHPLPDIFELPFGHKRRFFPQVGPMDPASE